MLPLSTSTHLRYPLAYWDYSRLLSIYERHQLALRHDVSSLWLFKFRRPLLAIS
jgi:hypothetical protein